MNGKESSGHSMPGRLDSFKTSLVHLRVRRFMQILVICLSNGHLQAVLTVSSIKEPSHNQLSCPLVL